MKKNTDLAFIKKDGVKYHNYSSLYEGTDLGKYLESLDAPYNPTPKQIEELKHRNETLIHQVIKPGELKFEPAPKDVILSLLTVQSKDESPILDPNGQVAQTGDMMIDFNGVQPFQAVVMAVGKDFQDYYKPGDVVYYFVPTINKWRDTILIEGYYAIVYKGGNILGKVKFN